MLKKRSPGDGDTARERIVRAAAEVFAEKGFGGARVDEIARRAGINKAMLYYHLGDKRALYESVLLHFLSGAWREIEEAVRGSCTSEEGLLALVGAVSAMAASSPHFPRLMLRELATGGAHLPEPVLQGMARIALLTKGILEEGRRRGAFRRSDPLMVHLALVGAVMALNASAPIRQKLKTRGIQVVPGMEFSQDVGEFLGGLFLSGLVSGRRGRPSKPTSASSGPKKRYVSTREAVP